jgi:hypothetical protein
VKKVTRNFDFAKYRFLGSNVFQTAHVWSFTISKVLEEKLRGLEGSRDAIKFSTQLNASTTCGEFGSDLATSRIVDKATPEGVGASFIPLITDSIDTAST